MTMQTTSVNGDLTLEASYVSPDEASGTMAVLAPFGTAHAGAMIWFADVVATTLALQGRTPTAGMQGFPLAITLSANLLANCRQGHFHALARSVKKARRVSTVRTEVTSDEDKILLDLTTTDVVVGG